MALYGRRFNPLLIPALLAVAVAGYVAGDHHSSPARAPEDFAAKARVVSASGLLIEYPLQWEQARTSISIPGLAVSHAVTLVPTGTRNTGLLGGLLPAGESSPLPAAFVARLHRLPRAEVVDLVTTQAYRYNQVSLAGYDGSLDVYVIPAASGAQRVLACYSPKPLTPDSQSCEHIVAGVTAIGPAAPSLSPESRYATKLSKIVSTLDSERLLARRRLSTSSSPAATASLATSLAARFAAAASSFSALEPPQVAVAAQRALGQALERAGDAYTDLAIAARTESVTAYDAARTAVGTAESAVDVALESYALLGYAGA
jgi:hypothetical protein